MFSSQVFPGVLSAGSLQLAPRGNVNADEIVLTNAPADTLSDAYKFFNESDDNAVGRGVLSLYGYAGNGIYPLISSQLPARGYPYPNPAPYAPAFVAAVTGRQAIWGFTNAYQANSATLTPLSSAPFSVRVANTAITTNSIVLLTAQGPFDATATAFRVVNVPGIGFDIVANANATANVVINYFVARYLAGN